ncbi:MAG: hypothetical protein V3T05_14530 [Myxococcota bacterium]
MSSLIAFVGIAGTLGGVGAFLTRLVTGDEGNAKAALAELEGELQEEREETLDHLEARLSADDDPRDEKLLRDLRSLTAAFRDRDLWPTGMTTLSAFDIVSGVEQLFQGCVASLEHELVLVGLAAKMGTPEAREPIIAERERILGEVGASIEKLSGIFAGMQKLRSSSGPDTELTRIREELDQSLEVAARVEARLKNWGRDRADLDPT